MIFPHTRRADTASVCTSAQHFARTSNTLHPPSIKHSTHSTKATAPLLHVCDVRTRSTAAPPAHHHAQLMQWPPCCAHRAAPLPHHPTQHASKQTAMAAPAQSHESLAPKLCNFPTACMLPQIPNSPNPATSEFDKAVRSCHRRNRRPPLRNRQTPPRVPLCETCGD